MQKPPWHSPIIAPQRHLSASSDSTGSGPRSAAMISPSETLQQLQTMFPQAESSAMARSTPASSIMTRSGRGRRIGSNKGFSSTASASAIRRERSSAIAGAEVRPGESMQAALKKRGASRASPTTKSRDVPDARSPAKLVIIPRVEQSGHVRRARSTMKSSPSRVVPRFSLDCCGTALGPMKRLPWTVGDTSTPLPAGPGTWKTVWRNSDPREDS